MKKEKLNAIKKALLICWKAPKEEQDPYKPLDDVTKNNLMYYFIDRAKLQKKIEDYFGYVPKPVEPEKPKKEPRWCVVHDGYDCYVSEFHTKKEALADMKDSPSCCWLIKGKIVKK